MEWADHEGGCACGAVRYRIAGSPIVVHACHCTRCQRISGSAFAVNAMIEANRIELMSGELVDAEVGDGHVRSRCPSCHVGVWDRHPALGEPIRLLAAGTLDTPAAMMPDVHCFTATRQPWVAVPAGIPSFAGDYDSDSVWSDEAKARLAAALEADI